MKIIHLSDIHLGKKLKEVSMIEDQKYILEKILKIIEKERPDVLLVAGDIYDKSIPSAEAITLFDWFLVELSRRQVKTLISSGNHDSAERLAFGNQLIKTTGIYISPVYDGNVKPLTFYDEYGEVNFYMLPFVKPAHVRRFYPDEEIETYTDAIRAAIGHMGVDFSKRNVLISHQFITGASRSESEDVSVGGLDNVDASVFDGFDYVALGHIHGPQNMSEGRVRYCGTPLKYSFSEAGHEKSVTIIEIGDKNDFQLRLIPLKPLRDVVELRGTFDDVTSENFYEGRTWQEDFVHVTLTDEEDIPDAMSRLRNVYHNILGLKYDNTRTRHVSDINGISNIDNKSPLELFSDFYKSQNGIELSDIQSEYLTGIIEDIWERRDG